MGVFGKKAPPSEEKEKKKEKKPVAKPMFAKLARKPEPDLIEAVLTDTVFGKVKLLTSYFGEKKKQTLVFNEVIELPGCVKTIMPHVDGNNVDGIYRIVMGCKKVCTKVITDAKGTQVENSLEVPVAEFVPSYMLTGEERDELAELLKYVNEKTGQHFELAKLISIEIFTIREKLSKAKVLFKGAKVRDNFEIWEFAGRIKDVLQTKENNTYLLVVERYNDRSKEDPFLLIERGKISVDNPEHLLKVENLIDLGAQFVGMERSHLIVMGQKSLVIECNDGCIVMIMPLIKKENLSQSHCDSVNPIVRPEKRG